MNPRPRNGTGTSHSHLLTLSRYAPPMQLSSRTCRLAKAYGKIRSFDASTLVFRERSVPREAWVLLAGKVRVEYISPLHPGRRPGLPGTGEVFGLTETLTGSPYASSLIAVTPCSFIAIDALPLIMCLRADERIRSDIMTGLACNLSIAVARAVNS